MKRKRVILLIIFIAILALMQLIPIQRDNPEMVSGMKAPDEVLKVLKTSCYDCHSNETVWPWYSYIAPVSWLVTADVQDGRRHLNFSEWESLNTKDKQRALDEIWEEVEEGKMPLAIYTFMHSEANLNGKQLDILYKWTHVSSDSLGE